MVEPPCRDQIRCHTVKNWAPPQQRDHVAYRTGFRSADGSRTLPNKASSNFAGCRLAVFRVSMARPPQSELGSARVQGGNITRQIHTTSTATGIQGTITEKSHGDTAGHHAQDGCGNETFVVGMLVRCEVCGKKFINSFYLKKHIYKRHSADVHYSDGSSDARILRQVTATVPLQSEKGNSSPSALIPYSTVNSRAPASDDIGVDGQDEVIELHRTRTRHLECGTRLGHFSGPQYSVEQNEVLLSQLQSTNEKVKAEVHKEVNDILEVSATGSRRVPRPHPGYSACFRRFVLACQRLKTPPNNETFTSSFTLFSNRLSKRC